MNKQEITLCLSPIRAMAGGDELSKSPMVAAEYARVLKGYGVEIGRRGCQRACEGLTWRPAPWVVEESIKAILLEAAKELIRDSMRIAGESYTPEQRQTFASLSNANRYADAMALSRKLYREFWDLPGDYQLKAGPLEDPLELARLLPGWVELEPAKPDAGIKGLIAGLLNRFKRVGGVAS